MRGKRRFVDAPLAERCKANITLSDKTLAQCGRRQVGGLLLCTQHAKLNDLGPFGGRMTRNLKLGDLVKVVSGPAFVNGGRTVRGEVRGIALKSWCDDAEVMVRVTSGGLWGFRSGDLALVKRASK